MNLMDACRVKFVFFFEISTVKLLFHARNNFLKFGYFALIICFF